MEKSSSGRCDSYESWNGIRQQIFRRKKQTLDQKLWRLQKKIVLLHALIRQLFTIVYIMDDVRSAVGIKHRVNGLIKTGLILDQLINSQFVLKMNNRAYFPATFVAGLFYIRFTAQNLFRKLFPFVVELQECSLIFLKLCIQLHKLRHISSILRKCHFFF